MTPELIAVIVGALGASGLGRWLVARRAQQAHVIRVRTEWVRAGEIVHFGPVSAACLGMRPAASYRQGTGGALGITGRGLVFVGRRRSGYNATIPLDAVRWIGLHTVTVLGLRRTLQQRVLAVHVEQNGTWRVGTYILDGPAEFAQALSRASGQPVHDTGRERADYGPARATRVTQDLLGEWQPDREDDLYLAPDRLLFNWRGIIPLDDIERLDVLEQGGIHPRGMDLLRIEHAPPGEELDVTGFLLRDAAGWADAIADRVAGPLATQFGRKKKRP